MSARFRPGTFAVVPNTHLIANMTGTAKGVYLALCTYADAEGVCYPGVKKLMEAAGCSRPSIFRALQQLCDLGVIERESRKTAKGDPDTNLYHILLSQPEQGGITSETTWYQNETTPSIKSLPLIKPIEPNHFIKEISVDKNQKAALGARGTHSPAKERLREMIQHRKFAK